jgi:shikimate dehydrogenase
MHHAALEALGLAGEYRLYLIPPLPEGAGALGELLEKLRRGDLQGLNVTIPHKQAVMDWVDELTPRARGIGAVNTLFRQDNRLVGDNTDAAGFLADLGRFLSLKNRPGNRPGQPDHALILGAGGSARAVAYALAVSGWRVSVAARRLEQAEALAASLQAQLEGAAPIRPRRELYALPLDPGIARIDPPPRLIVNTTPVGMFRRVPEPAGPGAPGQPDPADVAQPGANPWPQELPLPAGAAVYDLVYNPPDTPLMQAARAAGLPAANGLGMLLEQAALAFERWTGRAAPRGVMAKSLQT